MNDTADPDERVEGELAELRAAARRLGFAQHLDPSSHGVKLESTEEFLRRMRQDEGSDTDADTRTSE